MDFIVPYEFIITVFYHGLFLRDYNSMAISWLCQSNVKREWMGIQSQRSDFYVKSVTVCFVCVGSLERVGCLVYRLVIFNEII